NATPDSFSGDGVLAEGAGGDPVARAVAAARRAVAEGADLVDVGGESTRPGHQPVAGPEETARVVPVIAAIHAALPDLAISVDTTKAAVAEAALDAGASMVNDVWGVSAEDGLLRLVAERRVPIVLMHNRAAAHDDNLMAGILGDLRRALDRALAAGISWDDLIVDPGFGFGKTAEHNLALMRDLGRLRDLGRPVLLGTSRKSTLGRVLGLAPDERIEATVVTTALGVAAGVDMVRVHDVRANAQAARMADAIVRGWTDPTREPKHKADR
ncbi:MAG: dihydropteroate synthase, partial [Chloroflexi bacterium]|nr:dihydropteroate synthase [Chloroflexota bacterium]